MIVATISTASHLPQALVALESARAHNPAIDQSLLLLIDASASPDWQARNGVQVIDLAALGDIDRLKRMQQYYSTFEFCTALKPWLLKFILDQTEAGEALYLDADIWCRAPLTNFFDSLASCSVLVTRHSGMPGATPLDLRRDLGLCGYGTANGGVIGMRRSPSASEFIQWWQARLVAHCRDRIEVGEYVDQRWLDVALNYFPEMRAERIAGVNIGHWNLHELTLGNGELFDRDGAACSLLHFSQVRIGGSGIDFSQFPGADTPAADAFRRLSRAYSAAVTEASVRMAGGVELHAPIKALSVDDRDVLVRAVRNAVDEQAAFDAALASLPRSRRRRALADTLAGAAHIWRGLRALVLPR